MLILISILNYYSTRNYFFNTEWQCLPFSFFFFQDTITFNIALIRKIERVLRVPLTGANQAIGHGQKPPHPSPPAPSPVGLVRKIVSTWNCQQQGLWIILNNWVMISEKSQCCWVFQMHFFDILSTASRVPSYSIMPEGKVDISLADIAKKKPASHTKTIWMAK